MSEGSIIPHDLCVDDHSVNTFDLNDQTSALFLHAIGSVATVPEQAEGPKHKLLGQCTDIP